MTNNSKKLKSIPDAFGSLKKYHLFAVKSQLDLIPFTAKFEKIIPSHFNYLSDFIVNPDQYSAQFNVMYALLSKEDNIHCCIMENKTTSYSENASLSSNKEKNLPFQTISLFEDTLYLINHEGFKIFKSDLTYYDFLIFIFADKEKNLEPYILPFQSIQTYRTADLSYLLESPITKEEKNIHLFLKNCFSKLEIKITKYNQMSLLKQLGENNRIPKDNILYSLKIDIDDEITDKLTQNVNDNYLRFLTHEVDSL